MVLLDEDLAEEGHREHETGSWFPAILAHLPHWIAFTTSLRGWDGLKLAIFVQEMGNMTIQILREDDDLQHACVDQCAAIHHFKDQLVMVWFVHLNTRGQDHYLLEGVSHVPFPKGKEEIGLWLEGVSHTQNLNHATGKMQEHIEFGL